MLVDDYEMVDEKPEVAIITPADSSEEPESEPVADDCEIPRASCSKSCLTLSQMKL